MEPQDYWQEYVGTDTPLAFMGRYESNNPARCVEKYMARLPHLFGIVRRQSWQATFAQEDQLRAGPVAAGLSAYLEATREEWEPALEDYRRSLPKHAKAEAVEEEPDADHEPSHASPVDSHDDTSAADTDADDAIDTDVDTTRSVEEATDNLPDQPDPPEDPAIPSTPGD